LGQGVHSAYEDKMVDAHRDLILAGLDQTAKVTSPEHIANGREAAIRTVAMMRQTFKRLPPQKILDAFLARDKNYSVADQLWREFGDRTIAAMQDGTRLRAVLWESAWIAGGGESKPRDTSALDEQQAMGICAPAEFLPSLTVNEIGKVLARP